MANTVIINVQANTAAATADITTTIDAVDNLTKSSQKLDTANKGTANSFEDVTKNGGAIAILDQMTGGLASRMRDTFEATKLFNFSLKGMRTALIATGIGAFTVAFGAVVLYWDEIKGLISGAEKGLNDFREASAKTGTDLKILLDQVKRNNISQEDLAETVKKANKEYEGLNLTLDEHGKLTSESTEAIYDQIAAMEQRAFAAALEEEIAERQAVVIQKQLKLRKQFSKEQIDDVRAMMEADKLAEEQFYSNKGNAGIPFYGEIDEGTNEAVMAAYIRDVDRAKEKVSELSDIFGDDEFTNVLFGDKAVNDTKEVIDKETKLLNEKKDLNKKLKEEELEELRIAQIDNVKEVREEELKQADLKYEALLKKARKYYADDSTQIEELERLQQATKTALNLKHNEEDRAAQDLIDNAEIEKQKRLEEFKIQTTEEKRAEELLVLQEQNLALQEEFQNDKDALIAIEFAYSEKVKQIKNDELENDKLIAEAKKSLALASVSNAGKAIGDLGRLFDKGTAASKAAAIAEIIIGTGVGYIQGLDIAQKSAKGTGVAAGLSFPIFYAQQIAAVVGAAKQASNILKKVKGGGGGGLSATPPPTTVQQPSFNIVGQGEGSQIASALGEQQQTPVQAFVVSQDVTTAQSLQNNIIQGATLGG